MESSQSCKDVGSYFERIRALGERGEYAKRRKHAKNQRVIIQGVGGQTMSDVKWIKIVTDVFDDEKILLIEQLPEGDSIIVIWFKLLCLAGKQNNSGVFQMANGIAYTDKMLASIFRRKESTVQLALATFEQFGMVEIIDGTVTIPNWGKHQSIEQIEARREYQREYMKEYREKQKQLVDSKSLRKCLRDDLCKQDVNPIDKIRTEEIREDKKRKEKKDKKYRYGEFENVKLTIEEYEKIIEKYPKKYKEMIDNLSMYIESKGDKYKSHYATILAWDRRKQTEKPKSKSFEELDF